MKKLIAVFIMVLILSLTTIISLASASIILSKPQAEPGSSITISGTAQPDSSTIVRITNENGDIIFFEAAETDDSGRYSIVFIVPDDITANTLTVTAGSGSDVATALLAIAYPATPTLTSSPTQPPTHSPVKTPLPSSSSPAPTPTHSPTKTPLPSSSPAPTPVHSPVKTPLPSPTARRIVVITPVAVKMDEKAGIVTIGIAVSDLPKGTNAVKTTDGNTVFVKDAVSGVVWIEVAYEGISAGKIDLVAIGEDQLALATVRTQVWETPVTGGLPAFLWLVIGGTLLLTITLIIIVVNTKRKRRKKAEFFDD